MGSFKIKKVSKRVSSFDKKTVIEVVFNCGDPRCTFDNHIRVFYYTGEMPLKSITRVKSLEELVNAGMQMHIVESTVCTYNMYPMFDLNLVLFGALVHGTLMDPQLGSELNRLLRAGIELSASPTKGPMVH